MTVKDIAQRLSPHSATLTKQAEQLAFLLFCLCMFDCSLTGPGRYVEILGLPPRMLLGGLAALLLLPKIIGKFRQLLRDPVLIAFGAFLVYLVLCALRGLIAGNNRSVLLTDIKGFLWLILVPIAMLTVTNKARLDTVLRCATAGAVVQAVLIIYISGFCSLRRDSINFFFATLPESSLGSLSVMTGRIVRIFTSSCPYMVFACCIAIFRQFQSRRLQWSYVAVLVLCLTACLLTFTRSLYGCVLVAVGLTVLALVLFYRHSWRRWVVFLAVTAVSFGCFVFVIEQVFDARYTAFAMHRTLGTSYSEATSQPEAASGLPAAPRLLTAAMPLADPQPSGAPIMDPYQLEYEKNNQLSAQIRQTTLAELKVLIKQSPIFGNGLGACAPSRNGPDEYFYHDMLARMGIVGLLLYLAPFVLVLFRCYRYWKRLRRLPQSFALICGMCSFWAVTYFNPWMNAALGIAMYALFCALPGLLDSVKKSPSKDSDRI